MSERTDAIKLANRILGRPNADPDDDLAMLSRQFLRSLETIEAMHKQLKEVDWGAWSQLDLIHANRDQILKMHEEAIRRVQKQLEQSSSIHSVAKALAVLDALNTFHPMSDNWCGWPDGSG